MHLHPIEPKYVHPRVKELILSQNNPTRFDMQLNQPTIEEAEVDKG